MKTMISTTNPINQDMNFMNKQLLQNNLEYRKNPSIEKRHKK